MNREASKYPGFLGAEINPPTARAARMGRGLPLRLHRPRPGLDQQRARGRIDWPRVSSTFDGPGTQQVLGGGARPADPLVTVVVTHRVNPEDVEDFLAWQDRLRAGGKRVRRASAGTELFRPVEGVQEEWTALYRYDNADRPRQVAHLRRSARTSSPRARSSPTSSSAPSTTRSAAGSPSTSTATRRRRPRKPRRPSPCGWASTRPSCCSPSRCPRCSMPLWLGLLVGNLLSSFIMTFVTMPYYVNPLLKHWLRPPPDMPPAADELARHRHRRRRHRVLGGGLLPGDHPALIAAPAARKRCSLPRGQRSRNSSAGLVPTNGWQRSFRHATPHRPLRATAAHRPARREPVQLRHAGWSGL